MNLSRKDNRFRRHFRSKEIRRIVLKKMQYSQSLPSEVRFGAQIELNSLGSKYSISKVNNRCVLTSRPRGVLKFVKMSRIEFRRLSLFGFLPGIYKLSW